MHTVKVLHKLLSQAAPNIHAVRLNTFTSTVQALTQGASATLTSPGRHLSGDAYAKHKIKRIDRLLSNTKLCSELPLIYTALTQHVLTGITEPIISIDWSPLCADQSWQTGKYSTGF